MPTAAASTKRFADLLADEPAIGTVVAMIFLPNEHRRAIGSDVAHWLGDKPLPVDGGEIDRITRLLQQIFVIVRDAWRRTSGSPSPASTNRVNANAETPAAVPQQVESRASAVATALVLELNDALGEMAREAVARDRGLTVGQLGLPDWGEAHQLARTTEKLLHAELLAIVAPHVAQIPAGIGKGEIVRRLRGPATFPVQRGVV